MLLVSGLAADLDWISYRAGPTSFLRWHRGASHSLLGAAAIAVVVAAGFSLWHRRHAASLRVPLLPAIAVCAAGAGGHLLLDLTNDSGVALLWPFRPQRFAWDLAREVDPALLAILLAGLLVPSLLNLVSEEIGARRRARPGVRGAIIALSLAALYMGGRALEHQRADALLNSRTYRQEVPIRVGAFPTVSPLRWRGIVETKTAMHQVDVSLLPGADFDPRAAQIQFKPENSEVLQHAAASQAARAFLAFARFPVAQVQASDDGFQVRIRDLRDSSAAPGVGDILAVIALNARHEVTRSDLQFVASERR
jgi:inner membrane protein